MLFDTLKISKSLQPAFTADQAESLARAFQDNASSHVATKADLTELRAEFVQQISLLRADTMRWTVTAVVFNFLGMAGLLITLIKVFGR